ncbi:MAG TPA: putative metal-binding motif-containing protein [Woeseiaceae bacterium]|nr:putative metal-binding motif-containing protein [Woeseiaceae bacterium]
MRGFSLLLVIASCYGTLSLAQTNTATANEQLTNQHDAIQYYGVRSRELWAENSRQLTAIDATYRKAVVDLRAEYGKRLAEINDKYNNEYKALPGKKLSTAEHSAEYKRLTRESAKERAELRQWNQQSASALADKHQADRAAQFDKTAARIEQLNAQRKTTLQQLVNGPVNIGNLAMTFPEDDDTGPGAPMATSGAVEDLPGGDPGIPARGGGIDVAGTVPVDEPGDELVARSFDQDTQRLREQLFNAEVERKRQAEAEAAQREQERRQRLRRFGSSHNDQVNFGALDCDDRRASVHPGATEVCNYVDDDCDSTVDEALDGGQSLQLQMFIDRDGDRHGDPAYSRYLCPQTRTDAETGSYMSTYGNDCDDNDPTVWQGCSD